MSSDPPFDIRSKLTALARTPFATLFRIFLRRMFHGSDSGTGDTDDGRQIARSPHNTRSHHA